MSQEKEKIQEQREQEKHKEQERDEQLLAASAMEKADHIIRETTHSKKQIQNLVINIQQVTTAIKLLRQQIGLLTADTDEEASSVLQDKKKIEQLKQTLQQNQTQLLALKDDLIHEKTLLLQTQTPDTPYTTLQEAAKQYVESMITHVFSQTD